MTFGLVVAPVPQGSGPDLMYAIYVGYDAQLLFVTLKKPRHFRAMSKEEKKVYEKVKFFLIVAESGMGWRSGKQTDS